MEHYEIRKRCISDLTSNQIMKLFSSVKLDTFAKSPRECLAIGNYSSRTGNLQQILWNWPKLIASDILAPIFLQCIITSAKKKHVCFVEHFTMYMIFVVCFWLSGLQDVYMLINTGFRNTRYEFKRSFPKWIPFDYQEWRFKFFKQ